MKVVVIGAGPGGLCGAIEAALLGAHVTVLEKRDHISRNNVLKLWPGVVEYFHSLGVKALYSKWGTTGSDKIAIRRLQLTLLQVALLLGVDVQIGVEFLNFEPALAASNERWQVLIRREGFSSIESMAVDCLIGADGEYSRVAKCAGFGSKVVQFSNAIGMTFNFKHNRACVEEVRLKEFARQGAYFREWFNDVASETGVRLENFVYYKDETHYFVMAAKPEALIAAGILKERRDTQEALLQRSNIDEQLFCSFAKRTARKVGLPEGIEFALNNRAMPDMGIFDFTKKLACDECTRIFVGDAECRPLLVRLVGDALQAPFWPLGTGANKAALGALDASLAISRFAATIATPDADRPRLHLANLQEQLASYQVLKLTLKANELKTNQTRVSAAGAKFTWTRDPATRYVAMPSLPCEDAVSAWLIHERNSVPNSITDSQPRAAVAATEISSKEIMCMDSLEPVRCLEPVPLKISMHAEVPGPRDASKHLHVPPLDAVTGAAINDAGLHN